MKLVKSSKCIIFSSYWTNSVDLAMFQFLSMRLAAVNPRVDFNIDSILAAEVRISVSASFFFFLSAFISFSVWVWGAWEELYILFFNVCHVMLLCTEIQNEAILESNFRSMVPPLMWPEIPVNGTRQQYQQQWHFDGAVNQREWAMDEHNHRNFSTPENSLLSYDSSANSGKKEVLENSNTGNMRIELKLSWYHCDETASLHSNQLKMELWRKHYIILLHVATSSVYSHIYIYMIYIYIW